MSAHYTFGDLRSQCKPGHPKAYTMAVIVWFVSPPPNGVYHFSNKEKKMCYTCRCSTAKIKNLWISKRKKWNSTSFLRFSFQVLILQLTWVFMNKFLTACNFFSLHQHLSRISMLSSEICESLGVRKGKYFVSQCRDSLRATLDFSQRSLPIVINMQTISFSPFYASGWTKSFPFSFEE